MRDIKPIMEEVGFDPGEILADTLKAYRKGDVEMGVLDACRIDIEARKLVQKERELELRERGIKHIHEGRVDIGLMLAEMEKLPYDELERIAQEDCPLLTG